MYMYRMPTVVMWGSRPASLSFIHRIKTGSKQPGSSCEYAVALYAQLDQPLLSPGCPHAPSSFYCHWSAPIQIPEGKANLSGRWTHRSGNGHVIFRSPGCESSTEFRRTLPRIYQRQQFGSGGCRREFQTSTDLGTAKAPFDVQGINFYYNALDPTPCFHNAPLSQGSD
jgi:hypothetical protein